MDSSQDREIIFYQPGQPSQGRRRATLEPWRRLALKIKPARFVQRLPVLDLLQTLTPANSPSGASPPIEVAMRLGAVARARPDLRATAKVLLLTLCNILHEYDRYRPEELDEAVRTIVNSAGTKYIDKLKRGAKTLNNLILEWAGQGQGGRDYLDVATHAVLHGRFITQHPTQTRSQH